jgi:hypothetical protein
LSDDDVEVEELRERTLRQLIADNRIFPGNKTYQTAKAVA